MDPIAEKLRNAPEGLRDYSQYLEGVLHGVKELVDEATVFTEAFRLFERNANADFGMPGPLVECLDRCYPRYVEQLMASVLRKPTMYTLWMVNQILISPCEANVRASLMAALQAASTNDLAETPIREQASHFLHHHSARG